MRTSASGESASHPPSAIASASRRWPGWLVFSALLVFFVNMSVAWYVTLVTTQTMRQQAGGAVDVQGTKNADVENRTFPLDRIAVTSRQLLLVIGMSTGFGMMAIGFALFVLGIDSVYNVNAGTGPSATLSLSASSPGLLCFVLAAIIMIVAMTRSMTIEVGKDRDADVNAWVPPKGDLGSGTRGLYNNGYLPAEGDKN